MARVIFNGFYAFADIIVIIKKALFYEWKINFNDNNDEASLMNF